MDIVNVLILIIFALVICIVMMAGFRAAEASDIKNNRGTDENRKKSKILSFKAVVLAFVIMMLFMFIGIKEGLPYVSPLETLEQFIEIVANGSFDNFRR